MFRSTIMLIFITLLCINTLHAVEVSDLNFKKGISQFKGKNYSSALYYFKKSSQSGNSSAILHFNFGVTYYKLNQYSPAKRHFHLSAKNKKLRQISHYNLGLVFEKQFKKRSAIKWYKKSISSKKNVINKLAINKIKQLSQPKKNITKKVTAGINLALGYDDNVTSAASNSPSNMGDSYIELYSYIKAAITNKTKINASLYQLKYLNEPEENYSFYSIGLEHLLKKNKWEILPEISFLKSYIDGSSYQNIFNTKVSGKYLFKNTSKIDLRYRLSIIKSDNALYRYLDGLRHQFRTEYKRKIKKTHLRLRYQLEMNNRENLTTTNYSPTRHTYRVRLGYKIKNNWTMSGEVNLRKSKYASTANISRDDTRLRFQLSANKKTKKHWFYGVRYSYTDNSSNITEESYTRNDIQAFTNWNF